MSRRLRLTATASALPPGWELEAEARDGTVLVHCAYTPSDGGWLRLTLVGLRPAEPHRLGDELRLAPAAAGVTVQMEAAGVRDVTEVHDAIHDLFEFLRAGSVSLLPANAPNRRFERSSARIRGDRR